MADIENVPKVIEEGGKLEKKDKTPEVEKKNEIQEIEKKNEAQEVEKKKNEVQEDEKKDEVLDAKKNDEIKEDKAPEEKAEQGQGDEKKLLKNTIVHFIGISGEISRDDIKKRVLEIDPSLDISSVHFESGEKEGTLKFSKENDGKEFIAKLEEGKMKIGELDITMTLLEGQKEIEFLKNKINQEKNEYKRKNEDQNSGMEEVPNKQPKEDASNGVVEVPK